MGKHFTVHLSSLFEEDLENLPAAAQAIIIRELKRLEETPFGPPSKIKKLRNKGVGQYRLRVRVYRIRYDVVGDRVQLHRVRHRKDAYRD